MDKQYEIGIISGIISSIIVTGGIAFFVIIIKKIIYPKIVAMIYRGINLEGDWFAKGEKTDLYWESSIKIKQNGASLKGDIFKKNIFKENKIIINYDA